MQLLERARGAEYRLQVVSKVPEGLDENKEISEAILEMSKSERTRRGLRNEEKKENSNNVIDSRGVPELVSDCVCSRRVREST